MSVEANLWNKNNSSWREYIDSLTIALNVSENHKASFDLIASAFVKSLLNAADAAAFLAAAGAAPTTVGQGKQTIWLPSSAMTSRVTSGAASGTLDSGSSDITYAVFDFDQTSAEYTHFQLALPKQWNEGTVTFQPYWTASAGTAAQTCIFSLAGVAISDDDSLNGTFGTAVTSSDALIATNDLHVGPESGAVTIGGTPVEGDLIAFQLARDISDTLAADARLIGIKLFLTTNATTDD